MARRSSAATSATPCIHGSSPAALSRPTRSTLAPPGSSAEAGPSVTTPSARARCAVAWRMTPARQVRASIVRSRSASMSAGIAWRMSSGIVCRVASAAASPGRPAAVEPAAAAAGSGSPASGRKRSRSMRFSSISASSRGTSPPFHASAPVAWLSPSRTCNSLAATASALRLSVPLAENALVSGAAGSAPVSTASAASKAPRSSAPGLHAAVERRRPVQVRDDTFEQGVAPLAVEGCFERDRHGAVVANRGRRELEPDRPAAHGERAVPPVGPLQRAGGKRSVDLLDPLRRRAGRMAINDRAVRDGRGVDPGQPRLGCPSLGCLSLACVRPVRPVAGYALGEPVGGGRRRGAAARSRGPPSRGW